MSNAERSNENKFAGPGSTVNYPELMSRRQAAAYLGVAEITLAIWKSTGRYSLPVYKIGKLAKYKKSDLDEFIRSGLQK